MIERGNKFQTVVFGDRELPDYIRVGKFASKVKVNVLEQFDVISLPNGQYQTRAYLNVADLPPQIEILSFDLISMPPAPILKNLHFQGTAWQVGEIIVPSGLQFCCGARSND